MDRTTGSSRRAVLGRRAGAAALAALLAATPCALLGGPAAAEPSDAVTITPRQARLAVTAATTAAYVAILRGGGEVVYDDSLLTRLGGKAWTWRQTTTTRLDVRRRTISRVVNGGPLFNTADLRFGLCREGSSTDEATWPIDASWDFAKENAGLWRNMKPRQSTELGALKLLKRSKAYWERDPRRPADLNKLLRRDSRLDPFTVHGGALEGATVLGATKTFGTSGAATYHLDYRDRYKKKGTLEVLVAADGTLRRAQQVGAGLNSGETVSVRTTVRVRSQVVRTPNAARTVTTARLESGCRAVRTREEVEHVARGAAGEVNEAGRATVARIRAELRPGQPVRDWSLFGRLTVTAVPGGVKVVGHHALLKGGAVWTVKVRNGKAIARKVR